MCNKNVNFLTKKLINRDLIKENALRLRKQVWKTGKKTILEKNI